MDKRIHAIFDNEEVLLTSVKTLREYKIEIEDVYSPFPIHGLDKALGLKDGQIVQAVIENRGERTKLIINNKEFDLPKNAQQATDTKFQARINIGPKSALLIPTGLIPNNTGAGLATNTSGFTPIWTNS